MPMIGRAAEPGPLKSLAPTIERGSGGVPVGPPVFKTGDAALGVAWWVRLPCAPATPAMEVRCRRSRPAGRVRPASSACSRRPRPAGGQARPRPSSPSRARVVDEERARLAADGAAARSDAWPRVVERLAASPAGRRRPDRGHQRDRASSSTRTSGGRRGRRRASRRPPRCRALPAPRARPRTGRRGARYREAEDHLVALTGAEDALVTNNNAAALALAVGLAGRAASP